ncbi:MAG: hypothetical protein JJ992_28035, partial [Planctomycetes bacterium]|nr:hypothetical protein [Planctomycetota bacterium]
PTTVEVRHVTLQEAGQERLKQWSRDEQGNLILRLAQKVTRDHRIQIHGRMKVEPGPRAASPIQLPDWNLSGVEPESRQVDIYRRDQVQVRNVKSEGFVEAENFQQDLFRPEWGRWVASLTAPADAPEAHVGMTVTRNRPRTTGQMVTSLRRETDGWWAEVDFGLTVTGGLLDVLRLEVPADWKGPFQVPPGASTVFSDLPGKGRRYLLVRPEKAVQGDVQLRLRGPVSATPRERIRVPDVVPLNVDRIDGYVLMPTKVDQQRIVWERSGLQAKGLPESFRSLKGPADISYGTIRPRFQAAIKDIQMESGVAYIRLADHCVDLAADGRVVGVSTFDLDPAGRSECRLLVPEGHHVLQLTVAELPVLPLPADEEPLRVPLGPQQLTQRIQVLFVGRFDRDADDRTAIPLLVPALQGLPVENTCWTIRHSDEGIYNLVPSPFETDASELDWLRVRSVARLVAKAEDVLKDSDPDEIERWYVAWARRWVAARSRLTQGARAVDGLTDEAKAELAEIDENQRRIAERLGVGAQLAAAEQEA